MVEMAQHPLKLDNWMNEGIAFAIDRFEVSLPDCPIGRCPVMIGRRKPAYNTIDKVMGRLNPVNHETHCYCGCTLRFFIKRVTCPISVLMFFFVHERRNKASKVGYTALSSSRVPKMAVWSCNVGRAICSSVIPSQG